MNTFRIDLENVKFYAYHGVFDFERREGNDFIVNLNVEYEVDTDIASWEDQIWSTISYAELYELVKAEMETPRKLLETVALRISEAIKARFPMVTSFRCKITKLNPPIPDFDGQASVTLTWTR